MARPRRRVVRGAAVKLDGTKPYKISTQAWQARSWDMYDQVPFLGAAYNYQADQVAKVTFFPALLQPGDNPPISLEAILSGEADPAEVDIPPGVTPQLNAMCDDLLRRCRAPMGGVAETRRQLTLNLRMAGECFLLWQDDDMGRTTCTVRSTDEIRSKGSGVRMSYELVGPTGKGVPIDMSRSAIARVWRSHPRWKWASDSAMRRLLDPCEEFILLSRGNMAILSSRIANAGVLLVNGKIDFGDLDETNTDPSGSSAFEQVLQEAMVQAIRDKGSADSLVPIVGTVELEGSLSDAIHHFSFDRPLRDAEIKRMAEIVVEIVRGMDVVPETVFGLGEAANFATARVITAEAYNAYVDPVVTIEADALTTAWLRPGLLEAGVDPALVDRLIFWRDPSAIIAQPDMAKNAEVLLTLGELSGQSGRRAMGFTEADAPDDDERAAFQARNNRQPSTSGEGPNSGDRQLQASAVTLAIASPIEVEARDVTRDKAIASLGQRLGDIDRSLMTRLAVACDHSVERTLRTVGARLKSKAQGNTAAKAVLASAGKVDHLDVGRTLGHGMLAVLDVDLDGEIDESNFSDLGANFDQWVKAGQRRALDITESLALEPIDRPAVEAQQDDDRRAGWVVLASALVGIAKGRVFSPVSVPTIGEFDASLSVPMGAIRDSLSVAGGSPPVAAPPPAATVVEAGPPSGPASGPNIRDLINQAVRAELVGWTWQVGDPGVSFDPHQDLAGIEFDSWTDERLASDGAWPFNDFWYPSDHWFCCCTAPLRYRSRD